MFLSTENIDNYEKQMKVLFIEMCNFEDYPLGGHLSFALHMTHAFGNTLSLVGFSSQDITPGKWIKRKIRNEEYNYFSVSIVTPAEKKPIIPTRISDFFYLKKHIKRVLSNEYDIILIQTPQVLFTLPKRVLDKTYVVMPGLGNPLRISRYSYGHFLANIYEKLLYRRLSRTPKLLAAADQDAINSFVQNSKGLLTPDKVVQFPTRYEAEIFKQRDQKKVRIELNVEQNLTVIVTTGRLNWFKGWKFMIDAFCIFQQHTLHSNLYFIGDGEDRRKIESYILEKGLQDKVILIGKQRPATVARYLNASDLFIMGSFAEGWSTSLVEAIACCTPACVTKFSSALDLVEQGVNGFVVEERDEELFARKMNEAILLNKEGILHKAELTKSLSTDNLKTELLKVITTH